MKKNVGIPDKMVRIFAAISIGLLFYNHFFAGIMITISTVLAIILLATSFTGYCPLYTIAGVSTVKKNNSTKSVR